jgi:hypothetical protein
VFLLPLSPSSLLHNTDFSPTPLAPQHKSTFGRQPFCMVFRFPGLLPSTRCLVLGPYCLPQGLRWAEPQSSAYVMIRLSFTMPTTECFVVRP